MIIIIAIVVLLAAAVIAVLVSARKRSTDAEGNVTGRLTQETRQRDREAGRTPDLDGEAAASAEARERSDETRDSLVASGSTPATKKSGEVAKYTPADEETIGISRRQFFNRGIILSLSLGLGAFGAAALAFLYSESTGGFGGKVSVDKSVKDIIAFTSEKKEPYYVPEARSYIVQYPIEDVSKAEKVPQYVKLIPDMDQGIVAIYQKCVHLGCKVPWCASSQWFECPCHGSKYSRVGEKKGGPAPRGLDHFVMAISSSGSITIDTSVVLSGAPIGTDTTGQGAEGPPCVGG
ncbi:MAG: Rieske 2Fe-2S domain-containing protein [Acidimicrobiia bacterium]|nr:Rieske 2Fe-2S domain-containing protein [Acidimicrobiia bacterium]MBJ7512764.1 Rieske 2Fe-2S domain-containing protein [Acidimicrobiia bacterium]